jgi:intein/homing endonuclease
MEIKIENRGGQNRKVLNNPFTNLENEETQYWLGMLAADGCVSSKKYSISLGLKDVEHVLKYKDFISPTLTAYYKINKAGSTICTVLFGSIIAHKYLISLGITPRKSLTLEMNIPITRHFFRGVFDGDGYSPRAGQSAKITSGSLKFLNQLSKFLFDNNIKNRIAIQQRSKNIIYALYITASQFTDFYKLLYEDATIFMQRKEERLRLYPVKGKRKLDKLSGSL